QFDVVRLAAQGGALFAVFWRKRRDQFIPFDLQHVLRRFGQAILFVAAQFPFLGQGARELRFEFGALRRRQFLPVRLFNRRDLIQDRFDFFLVRLDRRSVSLFPLFRGAFEIVVVRRREEGLQTIEIGLRDRVEFVIVASRAAD